MKTYRKINKSTLTKSEKKAIVVFTKFDDQSMFALKYAVHMFGVDARYTLLCIYSFENSLESNSLVPDEIRIEMMEKLTVELGVIRTFLADLQPEIAIQFEFGSVEDVIEHGWKKSEFDLVVIPYGRQGMFGRKDVLPYRKVPILALPKLNLN